MTRMTWGLPTTRLFEAGVDRGVIFPTSAFGIPWNGLVSVKEAPTDSEATSFYQDGVRFRNSQSPGTFAATIEALTYPEEVEDTDKSFGFSYRTRIGNDIDESLEYQIHLVYNCLAEPLLVNYSALNTTPKPTIFSWVLSTKPAFVTGGRPSSHLYIDSTLAYPWVIAEFEELLYGTEVSEPYFPSMQEVLDFFENRMALIITDNGDGTWTATSREETPGIITMLDSTTFQISWPSAVYIDSESYTVSSL